MEQRVGQRGGGSQFIDGILPIRVIPRPAHQGGQCAIAQFPLSGRLHEMLHEMHAVRHIFRWRKTFAVFHRLLPCKLRQTAACIAVDGASGQTAMAAVGQIVPQAAMRQHFRHDPRRDELPVRLREQIATAKLTQTFGEFHARSDAVGQITRPFMAATVEIQPERQIVAQMTAEFDQHGGFWQTCLAFHRQQAKPCAADEARIPVPHAMKRMAAPTLRPALVVNICHQTKKRPLHVMALLRRQEIPQPIVAEGQRTNIKCSRVIESKTQLRHIDGQRTRHVHQAFRGVAAVSFITRQQSDGRQNFYRADRRNERPFETAALLMLRQPLLRFEREDFAERIVCVERLQIAVGVAQKVFITGLRVTAGRRLRLNLLQKIAMQKKPRMNAFRRQLLFAYQQTVIPLPPHAPLQFRRLLLPHNGQ